MLGFKSRQCANALVVNIKRLFCSFLLLLFPQAEMVVRLKRFFEKDRQSCPEMVKLSADGDTMFTQEGFFPRLFKGGVTGEKF